MLQFECSHCQKLLRTREENAGKKLKCPHCGQVAQAPANETTSTALVSTPPPLPRRRDHDEFEEPRPVRRRRAYDDEDDDDDGELVVRRPRGKHTLTSFPVWAIVLLHFPTFGIFTMIKLNLMHGQMPQNRHDDPSAGKAIGFMFIPFFNLYWVFFTYNRLCLRINEQRRLVGLRSDVPESLAIAMCILMIIPYIGLISFLFLMPIFACIAQAKVNELCLATEDDRYDSR